MMVRLIAAAGLAASFLLSRAGLRGNVEGKDGNLQVRRRRSEAHGRRSARAFMSKCMSNADSPRGKPAMPRRSRSSARHALAAARMIQARNARNAASSLRASR